MDEIKTLCNNLNSQYVGPEIKHVDITVVNHRMVNISLLIEL